ncbi:MAG: chemotaxis-specific protein-glutamate methyltransferase CheB [Magnetospirillum sp.]|nr:chemotaxis-specific protein-glutamate methyltransferase CheB [Magnetospirillum sp.]
MMAAGRIKVLVVEDSPVVQRLLAHVIDEDPRLQVVGMAADATEAIAQIRRLKPDIVTMDIRLPHMNGFEATRWIMREHPLPIVVVASNVDDKSLDISMNALRAGALSVVAKPPGLGQQDYQSMAEQLRTQLVIMSQVKVVRQWHHRASRPVLNPVPPMPGVDMVALVASTGGPGALARILGALPAGFAAPVTVVQHMGAPFMGGFAHWLGTVSALPVQMAGEGLPACPGRVYVAPGNTHLAVHSGFFHLQAGEPVHGQRPSGDILFDSLARGDARHSVGVLLSGMGEDGARGLEALRRAGGHTIAEAQSTAVIWGMPGAAVERGAAVEVLPVDAIAGRLSQLVSVAAAGRGP